LIPYLNIKVRIKHTHKFKRDEKTKRYWDNAIEVPDEEVVAPLLLAEGEFPSWSPDGSKIAFVANKVLFSMNSDGTNKQQLATEVLTQAVWSPSGKYILYTSTRAILYRINADGSNKINITNDSFANVPSWSPDEKQIAFVISGNVGELYLVNFDGTNLHKLTTQVSSVSSYQTPCWTSDGGKIMFSSGYDSERDIYFIDSDGNNLHRLENSSIYEEDAQLSLDGTKIYFAGSTLITDIYRVNSDGSGITNLTNKIANAHYLRLSPDGTKIAFPIGGFAPVDDGLGVMNADGSNLQKLYENQTVFNIAWSPDNCKIAFVVINSGILNIYSISVPK
jgi:Tol biopolymer transport system component